LPNIEAKGLAAAPAAGAEGSEGLAGSVAEGVPKAPGCGREENKQMKGWAFEKGRG
jgi:hypothetical protein